MTADTLLLLAVIFISVASLSAWLVGWLSHSRIRQRIADTMSSHPALSSSHRWRERLASVIQPLAKLFLPVEGWEQSPIRIAFINAGWRHHAAPTIFFGIKTLLAFMLPTLLILLGGERILAAGSSMLMYVVMAA
ncbi:MAG: type II secretion system F family protein, partial [Burkholderiaceae bacterium]